MSERQELLDAFYQANGPCCAGCDWWRHLNAVAGECTRSAPMASRERFAMLGMHSYSLNVGAGHTLTRRDHVCGQFQDGFDWTSLPPHYLRRIGYSTAQPSPGITSKDHSAS